MVGGLAGWSKQPVQQGFYSFYFSSVPGRANALRTSLWHLSLSFSGLGGNDTQWTAARKAVCLHLVSPLKTALGLAVPHVYACAHVGTKYFQEARLGVFTRPARGNARIRQRSLDGLLVRHCKRATIRLPPLPSSPPSSPNFTHPRNLHGFFAFPLRRCNYDASHAEARIKSPYLPGFTRRGPR
ncbi:hypothetical protein LZ30DRAFT_94627 [Colletotrichum cereale]|nr:hypothetical protein LZ30DRAFT_94627 [Colletotrichum cereale]